jgi:hypothetical protein
MRHSDATYFERKTRSEESQPQRSTGYSHSCCNTFESYCSVQRFINCQLLSLRHWSIDSNLRNTGYSSCWVGTAWNWCWNMHMTTPLRPAVCRETCCRLEGFSFKIRTTPDYERKVTKWVTQQLRCKAATVSQSRMKNIIHSTIVRYIIGPYRFRGIPCKHNECIRQHFEFPGNAEMK